MANLKISEATLRTPQRTDDFIIRQGTTNRRLQVKDLIDVNHINLRHAGLVGDGSTDDDDAFDDVLTELTSAGGGAIYVPSPYTFLIDGNKRIPANTTIYGDGAGSIIKLNDNINPTTVLFAWGVDNVTFFNFAIDGNKANNTDFATSGIRALDAKNIKVLNMNLNDIPSQGVSFFNSVDGKYTEDSMIMGCYIKDCRHRGINVGSQSRNIQIHGNQLHDNSNGGIAGGHGRNTYISIKGNIISGGGSTGNGLIEITDDANNYIVEGNIVRDGAKSGVYLSANITDFVVKNNLIQDNTEWGVRVSGSAVSGTLAWETEDQTARIIIEGNSVVSNTKSGVYFSDTGGAYTVSRVKVHNNNIISNGEYGIEEDAGDQTDNNIYSNNQLASNTSGQILFSGANTQVFNNDGFATEAKGTGSITSGGTTDVITHGLDYTPAAEDIAITLKENPTNTPGAIWVDTIGATNFTVNCENDPGASNLDFGWSARK